PVLFLFLSVNENGWASNIKQDFLQLDQYADGISLRNKNSSSLLEKDYHHHWRGCKYANRYRIEGGLFFILIFSHTNNIPQMVGAEFYNSF
ncbi:MAG: hypothetical protein KDC60_03050, partial [Bacteroidetes bacterium]|nr:hypothetical protein [Bacteroidota bacterium]